MADKKNFEISDDELDQVVGGTAYYGMSNFENGCVSMVDSFDDANTVVGGTNINGNISGTNINSIIEDVIESCTDADINMMNKQAYN